MLQYDLLLLNGTCMLTEGLVKTDIAVKNGKIVGIGSLKGASSKEIIDCTDLHILPGCIDTQVHFREPGFPLKEDIESGSRGAALGGITGFLEMPNTSPSTTNLENLQWKIERAKETSWVDFGFFVGATKENILELDQISKTPGCCGVKIFMGSSTGNLLVADDASVEAILAHVQKTIAVHSEDEALLQQRIHIRDQAKSVHEHPVWRSAEVALHCTQRLIHLARKVNKKVHILHLSTKEEVEFLKDHKDICSVETTPQHLTLAAPECYDRLGTYAQMNPPLRDKTHQEALWKGVLNGTVDVLGSDHAPHTKEEKDKGYPHSPSGMPGVQTMLPVMLTHVNAGKLSLERLVELLAINPAKIYNLKTKGHLRLERDADFSIINLKKEQAVESNWIACKAGWSPFVGFKCVGWPTHTIVRGQVIMNNGILTKSTAAPL